MMSIKKNVLIIMSLITMLLLSSCSGNQDTNVVEGAFIGGLNGVEVSFEPFSIEEDGVYTIFDSEDFPIDVLVKNKGEHQVESGDITLTLLGPAQGDFSNILNWEKDNSDELEKISEFNPEGGEEIISFTPSSYAIYDAEVIGYTDITWNLNYEYDYATQVIINDVCFKGDITDDRVCEVKETKSFSVSGAPITITSVEEETGGKGIVMLKINIKNSGTGESTIIGEEFDDRFSQVSYEIDDTGKWECKSGGRENQARLVDGSADIICSLKDPLSEDDIYSQSVKLTVNYRYQDLIQEVLRIKQSAE